MKLVAPQGNRGQRYTLEPEEIPMTNRFSLSNKEKIEKKTCLISWKSLPLIRITYCKVNHDINFTLQVNSDSLNCTEKIGFLHWLEERTWFMA